MAVDYNPTLLGSGFGSVDDLNANFEAIEAAFQDTVSRQGTAPNAMLSNLDMNSRKIINLAEATIGSEAVNLNQVNGLFAGLSFTAGDYETVNTYATLRNLTPANGDTVTVLGRTAENDGGGGLFYFKSDDYSTEVTADEVTTDEGDGGIYVAPNSDKTGASGAWIRVYSGITNVKWYGAVGDNVADDTDAFLKAVAVARAGNRMLYFPAGNYIITEGTPVGASIGIIGDGQQTTILRPNFATEQFLFNFNSTPEWRLVSNFAIVGQTQYGGNEKFLVNSSGWNSRFTQLYMANLKGGIDLTLGFTTYISVIRALYVTSPIKITVANATSIEDVYIQRFRSAGIRISDALAPQLRNITCEYGSASDGTAGGVGIYFQACQSASVDGYYTEGGTAADVMLDFKNQRPCVNTVLRNMWLNSAGDKSIWLKSYNGLEVANVVYQTPTAASVFVFTDAVYSQGKVYVSNIVQVDQNANSFIGDVRGTGQTLIPFATASNQTFIVERPAAKVGDGTDADLTNIANHTVKDSGGRMPFSSTPARISLGSSPGDLTATSSTTQNAYGSESSEIHIESTSHCVALLRITGVMTSSVGSSTFANFRLTNSTRSESIENGVKNTGASGSTYVLAAYVNLNPGINDISLAITRAQGGSGSNTFTVSDIVQIQ